MAGVDRVHGGRRPSLDPLSRLLKNDLERVNRLIVQRMHSPVGLTRLNANEHRLQPRPVKSRTAPLPIDPLRIVDAMKELLRTNNAVRLSWVQALLRDSGIDSLVLDHHTSLVEGSIGAIPRRLMVAERDFGRARALLTATGEDAK